MKRCLGPRGLIAVAAVVVAGCAGRDFVRPSDDTFKLGQTRYEQVVQQLGEPRRRATLLRNGKNIEAVSYSYATNFDEPLESGVVPARALSYFFADGVLVGQEFVSSFKADNSDFDATKVPAIAKGSTDRAEVIRLFGRPTGGYVFPMVKETSREAIGYTYAAAHRRPFGVRFSRKSLRVSFDAADKVSDVEFTATE